MCSKWYQKQHDLLDDIDNTDLTDNEIAIWYIGQCGFIIKNKDIRVCVDPVLNDIKDSGGKSIRLYESPFRPQQLKVDYVFCTHEHIDHMAKETILGIYRTNKNVKFIVPGGCKRHLIEWNIAPSDIIEAESNKVLEIDGVKVSSVSTAHPVHRKDEKGRDYNLAYCIEMANTNILHLGDTYITSRLLADLAKLPVPGVLMIPINGSDYYREKADIIGNISIQEAAYLVRDLNADLTIPMHYDMIQGNTCNPLHFLEIMWSKEMNRRVMLPRLGEKIIVKK